MWRFLLLVTLLAAPVAANPFTVVETGKSYYSLAGAVLAIGGGKATILIEPGRYTDCVVQDAGRISYRARTPLTVIFDGGICEGKAAFVLRGREAKIDGVIFKNFRVPDGNGAGIRLEQGALTVTRSIFRDSEEGILSGDDPESDVVIDRSTFSHLGRCDRGLSCAHSVYFGAYGSVTIRRSRFEKGNGGHYVKSRSERIRVSDCSFDDSAGQATNYMIDLSEGATGSIDGNVFVQGADKDNHSAFIAVAAEAQRNSSTDLAVIGNVATKVSDAIWPTALLVDWSFSSKQIANNRIGRGITEHYEVNVDTPSLGIIGTIKYVIRSILRHLFVGGRH